MRNRVCTIALVMLLPAVALAGEAPPIAKDPLLEERVTAIAEELRCLVCQNQTLADSHAPLAIDLKNQIREQVKAGRGEREVRAYMVERYGDFVLYRPPVKATTVLLWAGPFMLMLGGLFVLFRKIRRRGAGADAPLTPEQHRAAAKLLSEGPQ